MSPELPGFEWVSITKLIGLLKVPFDPVAMSYKASANSRSKWYGMDPIKIQSIWKGESFRSVSTGSAYHLKREQELLGMHGKSQVPIHPPHYIDGVKISQEQELEFGIHPELFIHLKSAGLCGQADKVYVIDNLVDIVDYKTSKEIKKESYRDRNGVSQKMLAPVAHLDDCNFMHYALQLSMYLYMILKHNPKLKPGSLILNHILFEVDRMDEFGFPIYVRDADNQPVVKEIVSYNVPYLKQECRDIIGWWTSIKDRLRQNERI